MKPLIRILLLSLFPCVLYSQSEFKTHSFSTQISENGPRLNSLNTITTDLTISPDSVYFIPGGGSLATIVVSNNTNQPINLLQVQRECTPGQRPWWWRVDSISVSTPHYIYPGQNISITIIYWTIIKDNVQTNFLQDSMYIVSSVGIQYCHIFLDPSLISSISENLKENFSVFPNPATSRVTIRLNDNLAGTGFLSIYNSTGIKIKELVLTSTDTELNIDMLPKGIYLFKLLQGNFLTFQKVVKIGN